MNDTNRALNRTVIAVAGLIALAVGVAAALLLLVPGAARQWTRTARNLVAAADDAFARPLGPGTAVSATALAALTAALATAVLLLVFMLRQGGGATSTVLRMETADGEVQIDTAVPAALLSDALASVPGVAGIGVGAYRVRGERALKLTVRCRRGASPREVVDAIDDAVLRLHAALGATPPVFAQLVGGFRARLRSAVRVDTATAARSS
ncbi:hypothetical protein [Leifsonia sp. AG29]|uniref:hypothetical protein n=1 Tax=Leifsonia sp. AG29 TaxID=2598860 RepID=UPI00131B7C10|nr:hypothetical protein [Leifsonia sp. AG29]